MLVFLQELCAVNKAEDEVMLIQEDSNEEHVYPEYRWEADADVSDGDIL